MKVRDVLTIYGKELRDTLRDRRTLVSMIVVPTLAMPALFLLVGLVAARAVKQAQAEVPAVMILGAEHSPRVQRALAEGRNFHLVPPAADWRDRLAHRRIRAVVAIPARFGDALAEGHPVEITLYHHEGELQSSLALRRLRERLSALKQEMVAERLAEHGLKPEVIDPFSLVSRNAAPPEKVGGSAVGTLIPYLFVVLCFAGAIYPAIDLTAGEKERGTMESLLCAPVGRVDLVLGKFLVVLTASLATLGCALISMSGTLAVIGPRLAAAAPAGSGTAMSLDPAGVLGVVVLVVPLAVLFSAVLLALSLVARGFKEAQSYLSPLVVVVMLPAAVAVLPGVELSARLALVPVLNLSLVSREMVSGVFPWGGIGLVFASSCAYAAVALAGCVWMFRRESVVFRV